MVIAGSSFSKRTESKSHAFASNRSSRRYEKITQAWIRLHRSCGFVQTQNVRKKIFLFSSRRFVRTLFALTRTRRGANASFDPTRAGAIAIMTVAKKIGAGSGARNYRVNILKS
ncbi:MAG: hypothetical protein IIC53_03385 [Proteobacteria bacterium]|nr:hypothetical protein [Pseudomonadota bacterium]MCH8998513.1 hypothetical protein [Pseudomonadota bacterium]